MSNDKQPTITIGVECTSDNFECHHVSEVKLSIAQLGKRLEVNCPHCNDITVILPQVDYEVIDE